MAQNHMTRLMCSRDRDELEALKRKLFRAGIRSEICSNPVANALGIVRLEINIYESDVIEASRIHQDFLARRNGEDASPTSQERSNGNGQASRQEVEVLVEPEPVRPPSALVQLPPPIRPDQITPVAEPSSGGELAQAASLLEKEVEEVLARDHQLARNCTALQDKVTALEQSLAHVKAQLLREASERSMTEQKLAEAGAARGSLQNELDSANLRLKTAEQSLAAAQDRLASQTRALKLHETEVDDLRKEVASRDGQLSTLSQSLTQTRAALENEKGLRQVAEQQLSEHAAARKSLEQQLAHFAELQAQIQEQNQQEREQIQAYLETLNRLRARLSEKRTSPPEG